MAARWKFEAVPDIFRDLSELQSHSKGNITTQPGLGLLSRPYPTDAQSGQQNPSQGSQSDWARFVHHVAALNDQAPPNVQYKVLYLTRHGVGYHNLKSAEVGRDEWNVSQDQWRAGALGQATNEDD
jgi:hypothetical protein